MLSAAVSVVEVDCDLPFDLKQSLESGQVFHWQAREFSGIPGFAACPGSVAPVWVGQRQAGGPVFTLAGREKEMAAYFGLDQPLDEIHATFPGEDPFLASAISFCPGLRLLRQPMWECLATFITSSMKQIAHIRAISLLLRERFGQPFTWGGETYHAYPAPAALAEAGEAALRDCKLGYRAKSLHLAARAVAEGEIDLEACSAMPGQQAVMALTRLHGVGDKIAHCALLFGAGRWEMFPIDVWIERVLRKGYRKRIQGAQLQRWAMDYFGENAGYAQQYLFHFARNSVWMKD